MPPRRRRPAPAAGAAQHAGGGAAAAQGAAQGCKRFGSPIPALAGRLLRLDLPGGSSPLPQRPRTTPAAASAAPAAAAAAAPAGRRVGLPPGMPTQCAICMLDAGDWQSDAGALRCGHSFCFLCIARWALTKSSCPLCMAPFRSVARTDFTNGTVRGVHNRFPGGAGNPRCLWDREVRMATAEPGEGDDISESSLTAGLDLRGQRSASRDSLRSPSPSASDAWPSTCATSWSSPPRAAGEVDPRAGVGWESAAGSRPPSAGGSERGGDGAWAAGWAVPPPG
eukprot:TRINITY_DN25431_c0_g1_i1.p1 TRINITY_DN25431_c0_g1~~TRINITY_DN25431_c0_g1_i1.p1  ORF type:complete len:281 (+),score=29.39 TRINITY_DN25431_c0_g1_i1:100-942(+)